MIEREGDQRRDGERRGKWDIDCDILIVSLISHFVYPLGFRVVCIGKDSVDM